MTSESLIITPSATASVEVSPPPPPPAAPPRRRASWGVVFAIALLAAAVGALGGTRLRRSQPVSAPPPGSGGMPGMPGMADDVPAAPPGAGSQAVYISTARQQLVGVRSAPVDRQRVEGEVRVVGVLAYDETRTAEIHTRVSGWIEKLYVDYIGKPVRRGQPLFAVYSPDLATAQADYLVALHASQKLAETGNVDIRAGADALLRASRDRMRRWNVTDAQIDALEKTGHPTRTMSIESPFDGVVLTKDAFAGQYVTPEMTSFKLADLSKLWAVGQIFEYEAARLHVGDIVEVEFPYGQAPKREAKIEFIYPDVDPTTRRVRFRVAIDNRERQLKPDTYVNLIWHGESTDRLVVPKEAVIDTGPRKYVLLALANGYFEPRDIQVGPPIGEFYPVVAGVAEGDRVVTSAQFLIDSETNLMAAMQGMSMSMPGMEMGKPSTTTKPAAGSAAPMPGMDMGTPSGSNATPPPSKGSAPAAMPDMPGM